MDILKLIQSGELEDILIALSYLDKQGNPEKFFKENGKHIPGRQYRDDVFPYCFFFEREEFQDFILIKGNSIYEYGGCRFLNILYSHDSYAKTDPIIHL